MNSQRSQLIFIGVIVLAIMIVAIGLLTRGGQSQPVSAPQQPQPPAATPLPAGSVQVNIESSNTKEDWMNAMVGKFNASGAKTKSGKPIVVTVKHGGSGTALDDIVVGKSRPVVYSPGTYVWINQIN